MTTVRQIPPVRVNRAAYSGLASTIVAWIVVVHLIGWFAGHVFQLRIGFYPVWFLDCTACLPRGGWIGPLVPLVGGMSYWVVVAGGASAVLAIGKRSGMDGRVFRVAAAVGGAAMLVFTYFAFDTRYPGSLPSVFVTVLPGAVAALAFLFAALVPGDPVVAAQDPSRLTTSSLVAVILGPVAMALMGGLISVVALAFAIPAYFLAPNPRNRRAAVGGLIPGLLSLIMRWNLSGRYDFLGLWW